MTLADNVRLALGNLKQAKLRTFLTVLGVCIGIASLSGMVSFGVGMEEQLMGRFRASGLFDSITVMPASATRDMSPPRGRAGAPGRGRGTAPATPIADPSAAEPEKRLDEAALESFRALPNVSSVHANFAVPVHVAYKDFSQFMGAGGVAMTWKGQGTFQNIKHGAFFANDTDMTCMLSLATAKRMTDGDPKDLIGQTMTLSYAASGDAADAKSGETMTVPGTSVQIRKVEVPCPIVGIVERDTTLGMAGGALYQVMIPLGRAQGIDAVQVTNTQSLFETRKSRDYQMVTVRTSGPQHTQDVEEKIKALGYSAFSFNDALQNAKRAFIVIDIILALIGSIALTVSSLMIMNTMVMSILERTREIGIMKAIGGSDRDIRRIFLIEASVIGVIGGIFGLALGWVVGKVINFAANIYIERQGGEPGQLFSTPLWLLASGIAFALLVSLLAGAYPARRAARLNPIHALRHD